MRDDKKPYSIVYEDDEIIIVYKKRDVLTLRTNDPKTFGRNLYHYLYLYLREKNEKLFIVHRLDYETSGIIIFAKTGKRKDELQKAFAHHEVIRDYEAVIAEHIPLHQSYHVEQYLYSNGKGGKVEVTADEKIGKKAVTDLESMNYIKIGTAMKIQIQTGRRAQIRLAINSLGFHLLGDRKYSLSEAKRMYLNEYHLSFPSSLNLKQNDFSVKPLWLTSEE